MTKHFYERSKFSEFKSNKTYHQLLSMTDDEFTDWARLLRKEVTEQWDTTGTPPVIGRDESGIVDSFKKLKGNDCNFWEKACCKNDKTPVQTCSDINRARGYQYITKCLSYWLISMIIRYGH